MNKIIGCLFVILVCFYLFVHNSSPSKSECEEGYLKKDSSWTDSYSDLHNINKLSKTIVHENSELTKIEIWNLDDDNSIVMIYFLEGKYAGRWGYTMKSSTVTDSIKLKTKTVKIDVRQFLNETDVTAIISTRSSLEASKKIYKLMQDYQSNEAIHKFN